jgi:hypothetical protein
MQARIRITFTIIVLLTLLMLGLITTAQADRRRPAHPSPKGEVAAFSGLFACDVQTTGYSGMFVYAYSLRAIGFPMSANAYDGSRIGDFDLGACDPTLDDVRMELAALECGTTEYVQDSPSHASTGIYFFCRGRRSEMIDLSISIAERTTTFGFD